MYKTILMPTDGSKCSELAIIEGLSLAKALAAEVTFIYAVEDPIFEGLSPELMSYQPKLYEAAKDTGQERLNAALELATQAGVEANKILAESSKPAEAILNAEKDFDLVVIGTHGRRGFNRFVFGSVAEAVIRQTSIPCLIVRCKKQKDS